jgi:hypothetical protein
MPSIPTPFHPACRWRRCREGPGVPCSGRFRASIITRIHLTRGATERAATAKAGRIGFDHCQRRSDRYRSVECVAAFRQYAQAGLGREWMARSNRLLAA